MARFWSKIGLGLTSNPLVGISGSTSSDIHEARELMCCYFCCRSSFNSLRWFYRSLCLETVVFLPVWCSMNCNQPRISLHQCYYLFQIGRKTILNGYEEKASYAKCLASAAMYVRITLLRTCYPFSLLSNPTSGDPFKTGYYTRLVGTCIFFLKIHNSVNLPQEY